MTIRTILTPPDPILRRKAQKVSVFDKELQTLVDDMVETLRSEEGAGLAAPQVGVLRRLIVIQYAENEEMPKKLYVLLNPELINVSPEKEMGLEGCLSIPGIAGEVERHTRVTVKGQTRHGKPVKIRAEGWLARIFQHEVDHLDGVLYTDRASRVFRLNQDETRPENV